jgi:membrane protein YqaA with SNARE-associated domain
MTTMGAMAIFLFAVRRARSAGALHWLIHLGGPGLIGLGIIDNSLIPLPGSTDVATVLLAAHHREPWFYYTIMATIGALIGGYLTYRMARKGGKETLEKKFPKRKVQNVYAAFERWGFAAVAIPAILPPPFPIVPMLLAAGAMQYPAKKFLSALAVGRGIRYAILAYLGYHYGRHIVRFFSQYYWPVLGVLVALALVATLYGWFQYKKHSGRPGSVTAQGSRLRRRTA